MMYKPRMCKAIAISAPKGFEYKVGQEVHGYFYEEHPYYCIASEESCKTRYYIREQYNMDWGLWQFNDYEININTLDEYNTIDETKINYSSNEFVNVLACDFDNTLSLGAKFPDIGLPNIYLIDKLTKGEYKDWKKILWTSRTGESLKRAIEWCEEQGLKFDSVNENVPEIKAKGLVINECKPFVTKFIDDLMESPLPLEEREDYIKGYADGFSKGLKERECDC